jgi:hypothetical protein
VLGLAKSEDGNDAEEALQCGIDDRSDDAKGEVFGRLSDYIIRLIGDLVDSVTLTPCQFRATSGARTPQAREGLLI